MSNELGIFKEIEGIKKKILDLEHEASKYREILRKIVEVAKGAPTDTAVNTTPTIDGDSGTLEEKVLKVLSAGVPLTTRQIMEVINKGRTNNPFDISTFSSRLIGMRKKSNSKIKSFSFGEAVEKYYGKSEWFNGDKIKHEYAQKIKNGQEKS